MTLATEARTPASAAVHLHHSSFRDKAQNAVVLRFICCLVNEQLAEAHVVESCALPANLALLNEKLVETHLVEQCSLLPPKLAAAASGGLAVPAFWVHWLCVSSPIGATDGNSCFWAPLRHMPLLRELQGDVEEPTSHRPVGFLDPEDVAFPIVEMSQDGKPVLVEGARQIMEELSSRWHPNLADKATVEQIIQEMDSSALHQEAAYTRCAQPPAHGQPPLQLATATAIEWEQSIVEGHATHPMHKARFAMPPILPIAPNKDLRFPTILFFAMPRSLMTICGPFDELISPLLQGCHDTIDWHKETVVPVHELQLPNIAAKFPQARQLSLALPGRAQASLRTVLLEALPHLNLKLAMGVIVSSAMRTISPSSAHIGPTFSPIAQRLIKDHPDILQLCSELASVVVAHPDPDYAKHFTCIIRQDPQSLAEPRGERVIVCAALMEKNPEDGEFVVNSVLGLHTQAQRSSFFRHYAGLFLRAFTMPLYKYGVSFEAHLQNVMARFREKREKGLAADMAGGAEGGGEWELVGFTVRDMGGIKVHQKTLREATGMEMAVSKEESVVARDMEEVHDMAFHTMIQCHLYRMARALGVYHDHDSGGWEAVKSELHALLPPDCLTRRLWLLQPTTHHKCFISMKLKGLYRDYLYTHIPNLITSPPL